MKKKSLALLLALLIAVAGVTGGTVAWLMDSTEEVVNTFTTSDIDIELAETTKDFKMIPGWTIKKDPVVTVKADSEACYVFIKLEKSDNYDTFLDNYAVADGWTALDGVAGVYYRTVAASAADQPFHVLKADQVTVKGTVTKADMNALTEATYPTLTVTAYACQQMKNNDTSFTAAEAWGNIK